MGLDRVEFNIEKKGVILYSIKECLEDAKNLNNKELYNIIEKLEIDTLKSLSKQLILSGKEYEVLYKFNKTPGKNYSEYNALILRNCGNFTTLLTIACI